MANNFSYDDDVVALYDFENGALTTDSIGSNTLTAVNSPAVDTTDYKQGAASTFHVFANDEQYYRDSADLSSNFPFSGTNYIGSICLWFIRKQTLFQMDIICKWDSGTPKQQSFILTHEGTNTLSLAIGYGAGGLLTETLKQFTGISNNVWYHFGFTYNRNTKAWSAQLYNATTDTTENYSGTSTNAMYIGTAPLSIGGQTFNASPSNTRCWGGNIDEVVVFKRVLTPTEITEIKDGEFGAGVPVNHRTLVYSLNEQGWFYDAYTPNAYTHYGEEGRDQESLLVGAQDGVLYQFTGSDDNGSAIECHTRSRSEDFGDSRLIKVMGDATLDVTTQGLDITATIGYDNHSFTDTGKTLNTLPRQLLTIEPDSWQEARNISLDVAFSADRAGIKLYGWEPRFTDEGAPLSAFSWETSEMTFGLQGFAYTGYLYLSHVSTANLTLVFIVDGVTQSGIAITHNSGSASKDFIRLPVMKGKVWKLRIYSVNEFRIAGGEVELLVKQWGEGGPWKTVNLFDDVGASEVA